MVGEQKAKLESKDQKQIMENQTSAKVIDMESNSPTIKKKRKKRALDFGCLRNQEWMHNWTTAISDWIIEWDRRDEREAQPNHRLIAHIIPKPAIPNPIKISFFLSFCSLSLSVDHIP